MKQKFILCSHGLMQKWVVNYWETYAPVVNCTNVRSLLAISGIYEFPSRSIDFLIAFIQSDLGVDIFMDIPFGMGI